MSNVYDFRSGRTIKNLDPQEAGEVLEKIRHDKGILIPVDVLEEAKSPESPLHPAFEWDDTEAAKQHRINQARRLITSIRILNSPTGKPETAFISVRTADKGRTYMPVTECMTDEELTVRVLAEARAFIESLERRYAHLTGVADVLANLKKQVG